MKRHLSILAAGIICTFCLTACGNNIFQGLDEVELSDLPIEDQLENAISISDFNEVLNSADKIINSATASNTQKQLAYYTKSEAILGKNDITPLDLFSDIATSGDSQDNALSILDLNVDNKALIESSNAISSAEAYGTSNASSDQHLLKGIVNTMIMVNTINDNLIIKNNGEINQVDSSETYWDTINNILTPEDTPEGTTLADYSQNSVDGFESSNSLKSNQLSNMKKVNNAIQKVSDLQSAIKNGGSYTVNSVTKTYPALEGDAQPSNTSLTNLELQLEEIFKEI